MTSASILLGPSLGAPVPYCSSSSSDQEGEGEGDKALAYKRYLQWKREVARLNRRVDQTVQEFDNFAGSQSEGSPGVDVQGALEEILEDYASKEELREKIYGELEDLAEKMGHVPVDSLEEEVAGTEDALRLAKSYQDSIDAAILQHKKYYQDIQELHELRGFLVQQMLQERQSSNRHFNMELSNAQSLKDVRYEGLIKMYTNEALVNIKGAQNEESLKLQLQELQQRNGRLQEVMQSDLKTIANLETATKEKDSKIEFLQNSLSAFADKAKIKKTRKVSTTSGGNSLRRYLSVSRTDSPNAGPDSPSLAENSLGVSRKTTTSSRKNSTSSRKNSTISRKNSTISRKNSTSWIFPVKKAGQDETADQTTKAEQASLGTSYSPGSATSGKKDLATVPEVSEDQCNEPVQSDKTSKSQTTKRREQRPGKKSKAASVEQVARQLEKLLDHMEELSTTNELRELAVERIMRKRLAQTEAALQTHFSQLSKLVTKNVQGVQGKLSKGPHTEVMEALAERLSLEGDIFQTLKERLVEDPVQGGKKFVEEVIGAWACVSVLGLSRAWMVWCAWCGARGVNAAVAIVTAELMHEMKRVCSKERDNLSRKAAKFCSGSIKAVAMAVKPLHNLIRQDAKNLEEACSQVQARKIEIRRQANLQNRDNLSEMMKLLDLISLQPNLKGSNRLLDVHMLAHLLHQKHGKKEPWGKELQTYRKKVAALFAKDLGIHFCSASWHDRAYASKRFTSSAGAGQLRKKAAGVESSSSSSSSRRRILSRERESDKKHAALSSVGLFNPAGDTEGHLNGQTGVGREASFTKRTVQGPNQPRIIVTSPVPALESRDLHLQGKPAGKTVYRSTFNATPFVRQPPRTAPALKELTGRIGISADRDNCLSRRKGGQAPHAVAGYKDRSLARVEEDDSCSESSDSEDSWEEEDVPCSLPGQESMCEDDPEQYELRMPKCLEPLSASRYEPPRTQRRSCSVPPALRQEFKPNDLYLWGKRMQRRSRSCKTDKRSCVFETIPPLVLPSHSSASYLNFISYPLIVWPQKSSLVNALSQKFPSIACPSSPSPWKLDSFQKKPSPQRCPKLESSPTISCVRAIRKPLEVKGTKLYFF